MLFAHRIEISLKIREYLFRRVPPGNSSGCRCIFVGRRYVGEWRDKGLEDLKISRFENFKISALDAA